MSRPADTKPTAPPAAHIGGAEPAVAAAPVPARSSLRLVGISCVGNEADIVEAFVRHNLSLLDHLIILEHNTLDGTREILDRLVTEGLPMTVEHCSEPKFLQRPFTNRLLRRALEEHHADWVFPIDCDEFLVVPSRSDLDAALIAVGDAHLRLRWLTYVPCPGDDPAEPHPLRRIRHRYDYPTPSVDDNPWVWKIAVNARFLGDYYLDRYDIHTGNHFLSLKNQAAPASAPMPPTDRIGLAHFPVRSAEQLGIKAALSLLSRLGTNSKSVHYRHIWREITSGGIGLATLAHATRNFLDAGRYTPEELENTPVEFAPLAVAGSLVYGDRGLPALAVILKWLEQNLLDKEHGHDPMLA